MLYVTIIFVYKSM